MRSFQSISNQHRYLASTAFAALLMVAPTAQAQDAAPQSAVDAQSDEQEIVVTATSRLGRNGMDTPTPFLVVGEAVLQEGARPNIAAALNDLPQFKPGNTPVSLGASALSGLYGVDLRALGVDRTLLLLDGKRVVGSNDLAVLPVSLAKRVEIVTGSSSAAWGSGAVAGVVNVVLDKDFTGARLGAQTSISERGDGFEYRFDGAFGGNFDSGRGHFLIGGEFVDNKGIRPTASRENVGRWALVTTAPGSATLMPDVGNYNQAPGGLITSGVNAGQAFNPDGTLSPFNRGTLIGGLGVGGDAPTSDDVTHLMAPTTRYSALAAVDYDLTDNVRISGDFRVARIFNNYGMFPLGSTVTIQRDNAFLSQTIRDQMTAAGQTSFTLGRFNSDFAMLQLDFDRRIMQGSIGLDWDLGSGMELSAFYTHGDYAEDIELSNNPISANLNLAIDAVINPQNGQPICRATLANPAVRCVPINLFGVGAPSQDALNFIRGAAKRFERRKLDAGSITVRGTPFELWAGPVSVAVGIEARREEAVTRVGTQDTGGVLAAPLFSAVPRFSIVTKEAFGEVLIPLLREVPAFELLQFNAAARVSEDPSGANWSWKVGVTNDIVRGVRLRGAYSRDIKAPNMDQLLGAALPGLQFVTDPQQANRSYQINFFSGGNPNLSPEESHTLTLGATVTVVPRLSFAVDYFDIDISGAIASLAAQDVVNGCAAGNTGLCAQITRAGNNDITTIRAGFLNINRFQTRGVDFAVNYTLPLDTISSLPGALSLRSNASWLTKLETRSGVTGNVVNLLRSHTAGTVGAPAVRMNNSITYRNDDIGVNLRHRFLSSGFYNRNTAVPITNNRIGEYHYFDLGVDFNVRLGDANYVRFSANVNNLFDRDPPGGSRFSTYYDVVGRYFTFGAELKF